MKEKNTTGIALLIRQNGVGTDDNRLLQSLRHHGHDPVHSRASLCKYLGRQPETVCSFNAIVC